METTLTRADCTRDNVVVQCPNATLLGFGVRQCKAGRWIVFTQNDSSHIGRAIGRVRCEGKTFIEVATAGAAFSHVFVRWVEPESVQEIRPAPPRAVFNFFAQTDWTPAPIFAALEYGISDMPDQLPLG